MDPAACRSDVALGFVFSGEKAGQISGALQTGVFVADDGESDVARLYAGILGRAPDADGLQAFATAIHRGGALVAVAQSMLDAVMDPTRNAAMAALRS